VAIEDNLFNCIALMRLYAFPAEVWIPLRG
jgi:hypothetical protein